MINENQRWNKLIEKLTIKTSGSLKSRIVNFSRTWQRIFVPGMMNYRSVYFIRKA